MKCEHLIVLNADGTPVTVDTFSHVQSVTDPEPGAPDYIDVFVPAVFCSLCGEKLGVAVHLASVEETAEESPTLETSLTMGPVDDDEESDPESAEAFAAEIIAEIAASILNADPQPTP